MLHAEQHSECVGLRLCRYGLADETANGIAKHTRTRTCKGLIVVLAFNLQYAQCLQVSCK